MRTQNDVLEVTKRIAADVGCNMADVAAAVDRQQSALCRQLANNPTWRTVSEVAWALGLGLDPQTGEGTVEVHWLMIPYPYYDRYKGTYFVLNRMCPAVQHRAMRENRKLTRHATWGRGPDYDPTDRSHLSQVYPAKALAGVGPEGAPLDSRFIEPEAPQPLHGKTTQGPGGAARQSTTSFGPSRPDATDAEIIADSQRASEAAHRAFTAPVKEEPLEQRQARLSEGAPQGYRLSSKALADAPRTPYIKWKEAGWDIDKLIHHGYLEVDPANPPAYEEPSAEQMLAKAQGQLTSARQQREGDPVTNEIEARRLQASQGCPDGWILSDKALEVSDDVTYEKLSRAMDVDQLKDQKYLVPRAWLGYD